MGLGIERIEEPLQLRDAVHRGDHEVEGRKPFRRHAPYANRPCRSFPSSSPCTTMPASSARPFPACSGRPFATSRSWWSTTPRPTTPGRSSTGSTTPGSSSSATPSVPGSPPRSTSASIVRRGRYAARLDSDDVARPDRLERQLARMEHGAPVAIVGSSITDLDEDGGSGRTHVLPQGVTPLRWHALFSSPFFHPTVLVDREVLEGNGLRYDPSFLESEDYDLWTRLFAVADGDNLRDALVLKRVHPGQASLRRADVQESFARRVALREIGRVAPELSVEDAELAWRLGSGRGERSPRAGAASCSLLEAFEHEHGADARVREAAARALARGRRFRHALQLVPTLPLRACAGRRRRPDDEASRVEGTATRVTVVSPEPTPYRSPLFDRVAREPGIELFVIYAARSVASRTWSVVPQHEHRLSARPSPARGTETRSSRLSGDTRASLVRCGGHGPTCSWCRAGARTRHRRRSRGRAPTASPICCWSRATTSGSRAGWRRRVKRAVVPGLVRHAASVLVVGSAARDVGRRQWRFAGACSRLRQHDRRPRLVRPRAAVAGRRA